MSFLEASAQWIGLFFIALACVAVAFGSLLAASKIVNYCLWQFVESMAGIGTFFEFREWYHSEHNPNSPAAKVKQMRDAIEKGE